MKKNTWQLQEEKSKFSQLVDRAMHDSPKIVTRHKYDLVGFLRQSPLMGLKLDGVRNKDLPRDFKL